MARAIKIALMSMCGLCTWILCWVAVCESIGVANLKPIPFVLISLASLVYLVGMPIVFWKR